jgi:hypothetical protein
VLRGFNSLLDPRLRGDFDWGLSLADSTYPIPH